ncbi:MAG: hypothetical protein M3203_04815 [Actinomycetota bacterium]|nr:hypothetical protein [Actinomycetota bacterium]
MGGLAGGAAATGAAGRDVGDPGAAVVVVTVVVVVACGGTSKTAVVLTVPGGAGFVVGVGDVDEVVDEAGGAVVVVDVVAAGGRVVVVVGAEVDGDDVDVTGSAAARAGTAAPTAIHARAAMTIAVAARMPCVAGPPRTSLARGRVDVVRPLGERPMAKPCASRLAPACRGPARVPSGMKKPGHLPGGQVAGRIPLVGSGHRAV